MRASAFERLTLEYSEPLDSLSYIARSSLGSIGGIALVLAWGVRGQCGCSRTTQQERKRGCMEED